MKRSFAYGIVVALVLSLIAAVGFATVYSVYDPVKRQNMPIDRVSMDQIKAWINVPSFQKWTNMDGLSEYLAEKGIDMDSLIEESSDLSRDELLNLVDRKKVTRQFTGNFNMEDRAITDIECDLDDRELEFEINNIGNNNWFLVDQTFTTRTEFSSADRKLLSDALVAAKPIKLYVNSFPVNGYVDKYWRGDKLFYPEGESFADACQADFVRMGNSVDCDLEPIVVRGEGGYLQNTYMLIAPTFTETGQFTCD